MNGVIEVASERKLYNRPRKEFFLREYSRKTTQSYYAYVLERATEIEEQLNTDLCNFNYDQVCELLRSLGATSVYSLASQVSVFELYTSFCIDKNQQEVDTGVNYYANFKTRTLDQFVDKVKQKYQYLTTKKEYDNVLKYLENSQDKVIFALLYEGAKGDCYDEILNLKEEDCFLYEGFIILRRDDGTARRLDISSETASIIEDAIIDDEYHKKNGEIQGVNNPIVPLAKTGYIIRPIGIKKEGRVKRQTFLHRIANIAEWFGNPYLTATNVWVSGQIQMAKRMKEDLDRDLKYTDYYKINKKYGMKEEYWNRTKRRIKDYLTE